jgi:predicted RecA/RadA family phage recombinase
MAANRKATGKRVKVIDASAAIASGVLTCQEGFVGIPLDAMASGAPGDLAIDGIWNIPVPASTVKGDLLYIPGAAGIPTEAAAPVLTRTASNANTPVVKAVTTRDAAGNADVLILAHGAHRAATQV